MRSVYSFGEDSPLKFQISDKMATRYNEAVDEFLKAQQRFTQKYGREWDPATEPIKIKWSKDQRKAWNDFVDIFNKTTGGDKHEAGPFLPTDFYDDFLVKNTVSAVAVGPGTWGRVLTLAVAGGALYGYLKRSR